MTELIQTRSVVDMIIAKRGCSEGYARQMIFRAMRSGKLIPHLKSLKYGTRFISIFNVEDVKKWLDTPIKIGRPFKIKMPIDK